MIPKFLRLATWRTVHSAVLLGISGLAAAAWAADGLDVRLGLWEMSITTAQRGTPQLPDSSLKNMTPEQRAKLQAALQKNAAAGPRTFTTRTCVRAEDLKNGSLKVGGDEDEESQCRYQVTAQSKTLQEATANCASDPPRTSKMRVAATDREHMSGTIDTVAGTGQASVKFSAKWLNTSCAGADDE